MQFDLPQRAANRMEIIIFDIKKEIKKFARPLLKAYMEAFHELRTGSKRNFEDSTVLGFSVLGVAVLITLVILCKCCCAKR